MALQLLNTVLSFKLLLHNRYHTNTILYITERIMKSVLCLLLFSLLVCVNCSTRNVCKNLKDYENRDVNPNCWYDPDVNASMSDLVGRQGYNLETYEAITEDLYILTVFRIPPKNKSKGIVFLQHPAIASSTIWVDLGNESIAFLLHEAGYDVWLGNFRGTTYSLKHMHLSAEQQPFGYYNFSFHEMGIYDLPAQFEVVKRNTNFTKIYYIGHSLGTTTAFVYCSLLPQNASSYLDFVIAWSPVAYTRHVSKPKQLMSYFADQIMLFGKLFPFMLGGPTHNGFVHRFIQHFCFEVDVHMCVAFMQLVAGDGVKYFSPRRLPVSIYQNFAGLSLKTIVHYLQTVKAEGRFQMFDYGTLKNQLYYHSKVPPLYPLDNINVLMFFIHGGNDVSSAPEDVLYFYHNKLPKKVQYGIRKIDYYNHLDFQYAKNVKTVLFDPTIDLLDTFTEFRKSK